jgi:predicted O-linked N-acetylglucosamine transferase (SPINDLY family)
LATGGVTFGSFNSRAKLTVETLQLWARILAQVPQSRLILKDRSFISNEDCSAISSIFLNVGIDAHRVEFKGWTSSSAGHFADYHAIDIALDPFPNNGTTTTCDAIWMGVPVVTKLGDRHAARMTAGILAHMGLDELVAHSQEDYVRVATELATNRDRLACYRRSLRGIMCGSPLGMPELVARDIEAVYDAAAKGAPVPFIV